MSEGSFDDNSQGYDKARRDILKGAAGGAVAGLLARVFENNRHHKHPKKTQQDIRITKIDTADSSHQNIPPDYVPSNSFKTEEAHIVEKAVDTTDQLQRTRELVKIVPEQYDINALNVILKLELFSDERNDKENWYANRSHLSLAQIDYGLKGIFNTDARNALLTARWNLRQSGTEPLLKPLPQDLVHWAYQHKISPEILAVCIENKPFAERLINDLKDSLPFSNDIPVNEIMLNEGCIARLFMRETSGFVTVGSKVAAGQINTTDPVRYPQGPEELRGPTTLITKFNENSPLQYSLRSVPGSDRGNPVENASGGAIGPQFMPDNALSLYTLMKQAGIEFNPWDINLAVIGVWLYFAQRTKQPISNAPDLQQKIIGRWNSDEDEVSDIYAAQYDYQKTFFNAA